MRLEKKEGKDMSSLVNQGKLFGWEQIKNLLLVTLMQQWSPA